MESKHTPGPWFTVNYADFIVLQDTPYYDGENLLNADKYSNAESNARLASKAPELYHALKKCVALLNGSSRESVTDVYDFAKQAINEAGGE